MVANNHLSTVALIKQSPNIVILLKTITTLTFFATVTLQED